MTPELQQAIAAEVTSIAFLWKLTRSDGVMLGFTSHDTAILCEGLLFEARPGMTPSAVTSGNSFKADSMEMAGVLNAAAVTAADLDSRRWDGARLELLVCDWTNPAAGAARLTRGTIGDVVRQDFAGGQGYTMEALSDMARFGRPGVPLCSPLCRAELGDARCGVDMASRHLDFVALENVRNLIDPGTALAAPERFAGGRLRVLTGTLAGIDRWVIRVSEDGVELEDDLPDSAVAGARLRLFEGCDKRFATCGARFGNSLAFDGEPHVPGDDALLRYADG